MVHEKHNSQQPRHPQHSLRPNLRFLRHSRPPFGIDPDARPRPLPVDELALQFNQRDLLLQAGIRSGPFEELTLFQDALDHIAMAE